MSGAWDEDCAPTCCGACGARDTILFFLPGDGWGFRDPSRLGLCQRCGQADERYRNRFRDHFGDIKVISDGDSGQSGEVA